MANCSIPNSSLVNGRISTRSLRRSRKQNSHAPAAVSVIRRLTFSLRKRRRVRYDGIVLWWTAALQSAFTTRKIRPWRLEIGRWAFSTFWRVKGAWWPSRSSKPLSSRLAGRDRFDSYPLRALISNLDPDLGDKRKSQPEPIPKNNSEGFLDFARNDKMTERR
jgi:hypothetical protein